MTLPASGAISLFDVNVELGRTGTTQIALGDTIVRTLFATASGAVGLNVGYSKSSRASPELYTTPGTYNFTVPSHSTIIVSIWGGGGGGGASEAAAGTGGTEGGAGGTSSFGSYLTATGGSHGGFNAVNRTTFAGGTGSGGDINESGITGTQNNIYTNDLGASIGGGAGGAAYGGGASVINTASLTNIGGNQNGVAGNSYGGGAACLAYQPQQGGGFKQVILYTGASGGGFARKTWSAGTLTPGATISLTVGAGGTAGTILYSSSFVDQRAGAAGAIKIEWT
jgi:hypothetical protein